MSILWRAAAELGDAWDIPADVRPWRPANNLCACCQRGLGFYDGAFCAVCEAHRDWCVPLRPPVVEEKPAARQRGRRTQAQAALF